jgi:pyridinium-3,5-bisthiocarboxylic acid mononucleotide nickel chelatase
MKTLYLDIFSGISGDMFVAALIDLGLDARRLERELTKLKLDGYHLHVSRGVKSGIAGTKFGVHLASDHKHEHGHEHGHDHAHDHPHGEHEHGHHHHHAEQRTFADIKKLISQSKLSAWVKQKSLAVFRRIGDAEGKIHGKPADQVHFHEVGAVDSIVDIVGGCLALEMLGKPRVLAAPVVEGTGWIRCAHGRFPIPAPATLAILGDRSIGITQCDEPHELVTPTGAALLAEFAESFGPMTGLVAEKIGFGLGTRNNKTRPNVLRAVLGKAGEKTPNIEHRTSNAERHDWETDRVAVLETNLDDISAEVLGQFVETALAAGALDVFQTPIQMKKSRPGVLLTVLCAEMDADKFTEMVLRETTAFGVRRTVAERRKLRRESVKVKTTFGEVEVKLGTLDGHRVQAKPEFESCRRIAAKAGVSLRQVSEAALRALKR